MANKAGARWPVMVDLMAELGLTFTPPEYSEWQCHPFGMGKDVVWHPKKGAKIPNAFQRWMLRVFFATVWVKRPNG